MSDRFRSYTLNQALFIVRQCHTVAELQQATHALYDHAKSFSLFGIQIISQTIYYRNLSLSKLNKRV